jgi:uncharacterized protein YdhG (YjbR/CyaY superfamily)
METTRTPKTIDEYIVQFPKEVQQKLQSVRQAIHEEAPLAVEKISYQMPTFYFRGNLIHFAAFQHHIGLYPLPETLETFANDLAPYKQGKGSVQFPLDQDLPLEVIRRIVRFRLAQALKKKEK